MFSDYFMKVIAANGSGGPGVEMQEKTVTITENGSVDITPDEGFALSKVTANVSVHMSGDAYKDLLDQMIEGTITELDSDVETVRQEGFISQANLERVQFLNATKAGKYCFRNCTALTTVNMPALLEAADYSFAGCSLLSNVNMPELTKVGRECFFQTAIQSINFPKLTYIGSSAFRYCNKIVSIASDDIPLVTYLDSWAFRDCAALTTVDLPAVETVGMQAFENCTSLTTVNLPKMKKVLAGVFRACTALKDVVLPAATSVESNAFPGCTSLTTIDCHKMLTAIGINAFSSCESLTALILRSTSMSTLSTTSAFSASVPIVLGTGYIYVPSALIEDYKAATNWSTYAAQFRALEDYTVDGTITGELDPTKTEVAA